MKVLKGRIYFPIGRIIRVFFSYPCSQSTPAPHHTVLLSRLDPAVVAVLGAAVGHAVVLGGLGAVRARVARHALKRKCRIGKIVQDVQANICMYIVVKTLISISSTVPCVFMKIIS